MQPFHHFTETLCVERESLLLLILTIDQFGEGPAERRDRLKRILAKMEVEKGVSAAEVK